MRREWCAPSSQQYVCQVARSTGPSAELSVVIENFLRTFCYHVMIAFANFAFSMFLILRLHQYVFSLMCYPSIDCRVVQLVQLILRSRYSINDNGSVLNVITRSAEVEYSLVK